MLMSVFRVLVFSVLVTCSVCVHVPFDLAGWQPISLTDKKVTESMTIAAEHIGGTLIKPITAFKWIEKVPSWDLYRLSFRGIFLKKEEYECHADVVWISNNPSGVTVFNVGCVPLSYINKHITPSNSGKTSDYITPVSSKPTNKVPTYDKPSYKKTKSIKKQNEKTPTKYVRINNETHGNKKPKMYKSQSVKPGMNSNTINKLSYRSAKTYDKKIYKPNPFIKTNKYKSVDISSSVNKKEATGKESPIKFVPGKTPTSNSAKTKDVSGDKAPIKNYSPINYVPSQKAVYKANDTKTGYDKTTANNDSPVKFAQANTPANRSKGTAVEYDNKPARKKDSPIKFAPAVKPTYKLGDTKTSTSNEKTSIKESPVIYHTGKELENNSNDTNKTPEIKKVSIKYAPAVKQKYKLTDTKSSATYKKPVSNYSPVKNSLEIKASYKTTDAKPKTNFKKTESKESPIKLAPAMKPEYNLNKTRTLTNYNKPAITDSPVKYAPVIKSTYKSTDTKKSTDYKKSGNKESPIKYAPVVKSEYTSNKTKSLANYKNPAVKESPVKYASVIKSTYKSTDPKNSTVYKKSGNKESPIKYATKTTFNVNVTKSLINNKTPAIKNSPINYAPVKKYTSKSTDNKSKENSPINFAPVIKSKPYVTSKTKINPPNVNNANYDKIQEQRLVQYKAPGKEAKYQSVSATKNTYRLPSFKPVQTKTKSTYKKLDARKSTHGSLSTKAPVYDDAHYKAELIYKLFGFELPSETASQSGQKLTTKLSKYSAKQPNPTKGPQKTFYKPKSVPKAKMFPQAYKITPFK